jgi:hypothetical protein
MPSSTRYVTRSQSPRAMPVAAAATDHSAKRRGVDDLDGCSDRRCAPSGSASPCRSRRRRQRESLRDGVEVEILAQDRHRDREAAAIEIVDERRGSDQRDERPAAARTLSGQPPRPGSRRAGQASAV